MTVSVLGMGWLTKEGYGCVKSGWRRSFAAGEDRGSLSKQGVFTHPFRNFGRMDAVSRTTACAVALALRDAGIAYAPELKQDIGLVGTCAEGSLRTDREYFKDYIDGGRTLSRGNLFIYTLPSSPLGESAIHFGLQGPLLYAATADHSLRALFGMAGAIVADGEAAMMLAGKAEEEEAFFLVLGAGDGPGALCTMTDALSRIGSSPSSIAGIVQKFITGESKSSQNAS
jgi:3-oxoacyl-[acyl-carrier-protein] synthase II